MPDDFSAMPPNEAADRAERLAKFQAETGLENIEQGDLDWALTHRSYAFENDSGRDNERLEFLGDAILGAIVAEQLYRQHRNADEGELSKMRAQLVSRATLGKRAIALGLGELMLLGRGERETGGARRRSTLGSALEALTGMVYMRLGFGATRDFLLKHVLRDLEPAGLDEDYKSALQEWSQRQYHLVPKYTRLGESGPDHDRVFTVQVEVAGKVLARADGPRVKIAENEAARLALQAVRK